MMRTADQYGQHAAIELMQSATMGHGTLGPSQRRLDHGMAMSTCQFDKYAFVETIYQ
jgi:hypothetical protein